MTTTPNPKTDEILKKLETGVKEVFQSERYLQYLKFMSSFHNYSFRNVLLILIQNPHATIVAGYNDWKNKHNRQVLRGEKGLKILAPIPYQVKVEKPVFDENHNPVIIDGKKLTEEVTVNKLRFKPVSVFDISQTEGEPIPQLAPELNFQVKNYPELFTAITNFSEYPISFEDIPGNAHGFCDYQNKRIVIDNGMSEAQNIKTGIHEVAHSRLHAPDNNNNKRTARTVAEVEAESVAFIVSSYFGIDTSDYSFDYIANWSSSYELKELSASLDRIQKEANIMIQGIEEQYKSLLKARETEIDYAEKGIDRDMDGIEDNKDSSYTPETSSTILSEETQRRIIEDISSQKTREENERIIADIKSKISIQDYAQSIGFTVQKVGSYFTLKEHDSVRINPDKNLFIQNSTNAKGSIIDFVMHFENMDKASAIKHLSSFINTKPTPHIQIKTTEKKKETSVTLELPPKANHMKNVFAYLINTRRIDSQIVSQWVKNGNLYQDTNSNCVFVTYDKSGTPNFVSQKGTNTSKPFQSDIKGSDYNCCHFINNNAKTLIISEAVIDIMSIQTILKANGRDPNNYNYLSMNGNTKTHSLINALNSSNTETIVLATDNDKAGELARNDLRAIVAKIDSSIKCIDYIPKHEKDWNAELVANVQRETSAIKSNHQSLSDRISDSQNKANKRNQGLTHNKNTIQRTYPNIS